MHGRSQRPGRWLALATAVLLTLIWGTTWAAIRVSLEGFPPLTGLAIRFALGAAILLLAVWIARVRLGRSRHEAPLWVVQSLFAFGLSYALVYWAEVLVIAGAALVMRRSVP